MYQTRRFVQVWSLSEQNEVLRMLNVKLIIIVLHFLYVFHKEDFCWRGSANNVPNPWNSLSRIWSSYHFLVFLFEFLIWIQRWHCSMEVCYQLPVLPLDRPVPKHVLSRRGAISFSSSSSLFGAPDPRQLSQVFCLHWHRFSIFYRMEDIAFTISRW